MTLRILLADDHSILRDGLRAILKTEMDMQVVGEAADGTTAVQMANTLCPDVVVMDIGMPGLNGVEATRQILHADAKVKVIAASPPIPTSNSCWGCSTPARRATWSKARPAKNC